MSTFFRASTKLLRGISMLFRNPALINRILDEPEWYKEKVLSVYNLPFGLPEISLPDLLGKHEINVKPYAALEGGSMITDLALLRALAKRFLKGSYFEIGTWRGESAVNVLDEGLNVYTLNLSESDMQKRKWDEEYIRLHGFFSRQYGEIVHLAGDSRIFDFTPYHRKMDMVFVDGDHHHDTVVEDTRNAFKLLKDENSCIVWHDYGLNPENVRWNILHAILEGTPEHLRTHLYAVSNSLSAIYMPSWAGLTRNRIYPSQPIGAFSVKVSFDNLRSV